MDFGGGVFACVWVNLVVVVVGGLLGCDNDNDDGADSAGGALGGGLS